MAAVYDLASALASVGAAPPAAPAGAAPVNPLSAPPAGLPSFDPNAGAPAPARDPNASPFANMLAANPIIGGPEKAAAAQVNQLAQRPTPFEKIGNLFGGNDATTAALNERSRLADFYGDPNTQKYIVSHPEFASAATADPGGFASKLQPVIAAAMKAPTTSVAHPNADGTVTTKAVPDAAKLAAVSQITGERPEDANPFLHHHTYTDEEFINATQNLNWKQASRLFGAAQRLTPQQQLVPVYMDHLNKVESTAQAAYDKAVAAKASTADKQAAFAVLKNAQDSKVDFVKKMTEGSNFIYPGQQQ